MANAISTLRWPTVVLPEPFELAMHELGAAGRHLKARAPTSSKTAMSR